jgi:(2Fe-2S) ferredoxin
MSGPQRRVFVCTQQRPALHPRGSCAASGATAVLQAFWAEQQRRQAYDAVAITYSGCLGPCEGGPNVLVYPEAVLYQKVTAADVAEIFDSHLERGNPVERLCGGVKPQVDAA